VPLKLLHGHEFIYGFATAIIVAHRPDRAAELGRHRGNRRARLMLLVGAVAGRAHRLLGAPWLPPPLPA
jgi:hypothetical protein